MDLKATLQRKKPAQAVSADDPVLVARQRARYRLLGAAVLLVLGIVGFPWLFDNRPRPLSLDTPVVASAKVNTEAPARTARPASAPEVDPNANLEAESPAASEPARAEAAAGAAATAPASAPAVAAGPAPVMPAVPAPPLPATPAPASAVTVAAAPAAAAKPAAAAPAPSSSRPAAAETGRFVVQVGAFSDAAVIRETRQKVERLGLKTYTQMVDTDGGKRTRVRVGPFATREAANQAAARLKKASLPGTVLTL